jgi:hypothetical protein
VTDDVQGQEARWELWARLIAPLVHDGLIDVPTTERMDLPDKAFTLARTLDAVLPE